MMLTDPQVSDCFLKIWERYGDAPVAIESFINNHLNPDLQGDLADATFLRMSPPGDPHQRCSALLSKQELSSILDIMSERQARFGNPATSTVSELPNAVRAQTAAPRIIRGLLDFMDEDRMTLDQIRQMRALDVGFWTVSLA